MIEEFHNIEPYSLSKKEKNQLLTRELTELTTYHREHCEQYDNILSAFELNEKNIKQELNRGLFIEIPLKEKLPTYNIYIAKLENNKKINQFINIA